MSGLQHMRVRGADLRLPAERLDVRWLVTGDADDERAFLEARRANGQSDAAGDLRRFMAEGYTYVLGYKGGTPVGSAAEWEHEPGSSIVAATLGAPAYREDDVLAALIYHVAQRILTKAPEAVFVHEDDDGASVLAAAEVGFRNG